MVVGSLCVLLQAVDGVVDFWGVSVLNASEAEMAAIGYSGISVMSMVVGETRK